MLHIMTVIVIIVLDCILRTSYSCKLSQISYFPEVTYLSRMGI
jgi:hypothetical protein